MKLSVTFLAILAIAVALAQSADVSSSKNNQMQTNEKVIVAQDDVIAAAVYNGVDGDDVDELDDDIDDETEIDGIKLKLLSREELGQFLKEEDKLLQAELDILVAKNELAVPLKARRKRWVPVAAAAGRVLFTAGRALFRGSRLARTTTSGSRITRQYNRAGSFTRANRDFDRFNPSGVSSFSGRVNGRTGTIGNGHRITVRDSSSSGRPTLEIRTNRPNGSELVRKFRYND